MSVISCAATKHLRLLLAGCDTCGMETVHLLAYSDCAYWGVDRACTSCGAEDDEGPLVPADESVDDQLVRIAEICARADRACECPMVFWEGELEGGMMHAPCVHELARGMSVEMVTFLLREVGGIVKVGIGLERERRGPVFDLLPVGTILDDGEYITMAALKKPDGTWETQGGIGPLEVRQAFMYGRIKVRPVRR